MVWVWSRWRLDVVVVWLGTPRCLVAVCVERRDLAGQEMGAEVAWAWSGDDTLIDSLRAYKQILMYM
mgnify:CR=1 FL=1